MHSCGFPTWPNIWPTAAWPLWVGGDVPQTLTGVPTCQALAADLAQRYGLATGLPLAEVAQRLARRGQRWEFTDFLQRTLGAADHGPQSWHALLASLPVSHFIATAYDDLLARALRAGSRPSITWCRPARWPCARRAPSA
ncbi:hypothetical protein [Candidatus Amarolinea dominans]|uniref:hypothetical protein n=1 Tax=Candidatus Amarolinea dominans TaxID=3140696 RepID=UPI001D726D28|nr:hypothetical protein [Anaerolineae bacterium]